MQASAFTEACHGHAVDRSLMVPDNALGADLLSGEEVFVGPGSSLCASEIEMCKITVAPTAAASESTEQGYARPIRLQDSSQVYVPPTLACVLAVRESEGTVDQRSDVKFNLR